MDISIFNIAISQQHGSTVSEEDLGGLLLWKGHPLKCRGFPVDEPMPFSPVQSARKFAAVLGVTSANSSRTILPAEDTQQFDYHYGIKVSFTPDRPPAFIQTEKTPRDGKCCTFRENSNQLWIMTSPMIKVGLTDGFLHAEHTWVPNTSTIRQSSREQVR